MKNRFDISSFVSVATEQSVMTALVERVKKIRKELKITQKELSMRSGVSLGSIRRFEAIGEISFHSLLKVGNALGCLDDFNLLFKSIKPTNLKDY